MKNQIAKPNHLWRPVCHLILCIIFFTGCETDEFQVIDERAPGDQMSTEGSMGALQVQCSLLGPSTVDAGPVTKTYSFITDVSSPVFQWEITSGSATIACPTCASTNITFSSSGNVTIKCTATSSDGSEICGESLQVSRSGGTLCACPNPIVSIFDPYPGDPNINCNVTSTGLNSFSVSGTKSGDIISWTGVNASIQNGQGTSTVAVYIPNTNNDFSVTASVTRNCSGGTSYTRTSTYSSNVSQACKYYGRQQGGDQCGLITD